MGEATLTIGEVAGRAGVATSTLRFYEAEGLIESERSTGNQRRYHRSVLRRIAVIRVAQSLGITLAEVKQQLAGLPDGQNPDRAAWADMSDSWRGDLDARIDRLVALRDDLSGCIGCGCLSVDTCRFFNPGDSAARKGPGPRYLMGDG